MSYKQLCFFLVIFGVISLSSCLKVQTCSHNQPEPIAVEIQGCVTEPCDLLDGTDALINVTFLVGSDTNTLKPKVRAVVGGITVPYTLPKEKQNACNFLLNGYCPLDKGERIVYQLQMPISGYPAISLTIELSILGDNNEVFSCFKVACKVVNNQNSLDFLLD